MHFTDDDDNVGILIIGWWIGLACTWAFLVYHWGSAQYAQQAQEYAQRGAIAHFFHYGDPAGSVFGYILIAGFGMWFMHMPAAFIAPCHFEWMKRQQARRKEGEAKETIQRVTSESKTRRDDSERSQSQQEIITRLGAIDSFLRVLKGERDSSKRTVALQAAQAEIVALEAKWIAGKIPQEVLTDSAIRAHVQETSDHLVRIGLAEDRLNRELLRIFQITA